MLLPRASLLQDILGTHPVLFHNIVNCIAPFDWNRLAPLKLHHPCLVVHTQGSRPGFGQRMKPEGTSLEQIWRVFLQINYLECCFVYLILPQLHHLCRTGKDKRLARQPVEEDMSVMYWELRCCYISVLDGKIWNAHLYYYRYCNMLHVTLQQHLLDNRSCVGSPIQVHDHWHKLCNSSVSRTHW